MYLSLGFDFGQDRLAPVVGLDVPQRFTFFDLLHHVGPVGPLARRLLQRFQTLCDRR